MKQVSNDFLSGIHKTGRRFNNSIQYTINNATRYVLTDKIFRIKFNGYGEIGKTIMMSYEVDCTEDLPEDGLYLIRAGVQSGNYTDWALGSKMYMTDKKYREDKKLYEYTFCDAMVKTMVDFDWGTIVGNYDTITLTTLITSILDYIGFTYSTTGLPNVSTINIKRSQIDGIRLTCRDVLDMALELCGVSLKTIDDNGSSKYVIVDPTATPDSTNTIIVTKDEIIDDMAYTKEKYGPVNSILFESEVSESDNLERKDSTSIANNGLTQYKITGNLLLDNDNRATAIDILYNQLNGFQYYLCDLRTIGFMYVEPLDNINLVLIYGQENYICKVTSDVFTLEDGLEETIQSEKPKQTTEEYIGGSPYDDKKARIDVDKMKGEIVLKTDSDGKIAQVRLDSSGDDGSVVQIKGTQINLEGTTTINDRFKIDTNGYMYAKAGGEVAGWKISDDALYKYVRIGDYDYMTYIQSPLTTYTEDSWIFSTQKKHKDALGYGGTAIIKLGGDIKGKDITASGNITATNNLLVQNKLEGYLNLNDAKTHYLGEYGLYFTDETFTIVGTNEYTRYTHNGFAVNGNGAMSGSLWLQNVYPQSKVEIKKNIKLYDKNALDILKNIDIYNYNFKTEEDKDKKHIGFIIGDDYKYSKEITNNDNSGVDLYSFVSVCCKAIQEQQKEIEELKEQIEKLSKK